MGIAELPLTISSIRNHLFLKSAFTRHWILMLIAGLSLPILSTRNHLFLLYGVYNRARMRLSIVGVTPPGGATGLQFPTRPHTHKASQLASL